MRVDLKLKHIEANIGYVYNNVSYEDVEAVEYVTDGCVKYLYIYLTGKKEPEKIQRVSIKDFAVRREDCAAA